MAKETIELQRPVIPIVDADRARRFVGDPVSVKGRAVHADGGAGIELPDVIIRCPELPDWPEDVVGKTVTATGVLARRGEDDPPIYELHEARYEIEGAEAPREIDLEGD